MKATLSFDMEDIDDRMAHMRCVKSLDLTLALYTIKEILRDTWSRFDEENPDHERIVKLHEKLNEVYTDYNIELDELTR